ncbi:putative coiled-coil protein SlyX [Bradyrhizobium sp. S3.12.5]
MTTTSETLGFAEHLDAAALAAAAFEPQAEHEAEHEAEPAAAEAPAPGKRSSRKSVLALSVCALAINGAAIYTSPFDLPSPNINSLAALLPRQEEPIAKPDPIVAALKDIQSAQQQQAASLQEINSSLQQNAALRQQDSTTLVSLRQSITDERGDVKKISPQLSTLIAKIDSLQTAMTSDVTSSIRRAHARYGLSAAMRKRMVRQSKSIGPISVGGAPLTAPATVAAPES